MIVIIEIANRLAVSGHTVSLVIPGGTQDQESINALNPQINVLETKQKMQNQPRDLSVFDKIRITFDLAFRLPPSDVIVSTQTPTTVAGFISSFLLRKGKLIWFFQDYEEMFLRRPLERVLMRNAMLWHEKALVVSEFSREELQKLTKKKVTVVGLGLHKSHLFVPLEKNHEHRSSEIRVILFLGDMRPRKGLFDFLIAAEEVYKVDKKIKLVIVSKDECNYQTTVPNQFIFRPSREELATLYKTCNVFVSASWWESFGLPPLEAMACGAPVVMTDTRGGKEYAINGENCLIVPPQNPAALAHAILDVLGNKNLESHLRFNGPLTAKKFSWEKCVRLFEEEIRLS